MRGIPLRAASAETRWIRKHLLADRGASATSISPYWCRDDTDEEWRVVKRAFMAEQKGDV